MSRSFLAAVAVLIVLTGTAAVLAVRNARPVPPAAPAPPAERGTPLPPQDSLLGTWEASGVVKMSRGSADQPVGTELRRRWVFYNHCGADGCRPWLIRETADVAERAQVARSRIEETAVFTRRTDGCNTSETGMLTRTFRITPASGGRLEAAESVQGSYPGCTQSGIGTGRLVSTVAWSLSKLSNDCTASFPTCRD